MEFRVYARGEAVGTCEVKSQGLYWEIHCVCRKYASYPVRLLGEGYNLGVLEAVGERLVLKRKFAKSSAEEFSARQGFVLFPVDESCIDVGGVFLSGDIEKTENATRLYIPCVKDRPHPYISMLCFCQIHNGFWVLCLDENNCPVFCD